MGRFWELVTKRIQQLAANSLFLWKQGIFLSEQGMRPAGQRNRQVGASARRCTHSAAPSPPAVQRPRRSGDRGVLRNSESCRTSTVELGMARMAELCRHRTGVRYPLVGRDDA